MSDAMKLMELVWRGNAKAARFSWERLNHAMWKALHLAIANGMNFAEGDFAEIKKRFGMSYWGINNGHMLGEGFYYAACTTGNLSACRSFEAWKGRGPFIVDQVDPCAYGGSPGLHRASDRKRGRVAVGCRFPWKG